jgi:hypothetical protein
MPDDSPTTPRREQQLSYIFKPAKVSIDGRPNCLNPSDSPRRMSNRLSLSSSSSASGRDSVVSQISYVRPWTPSLRGPMVYEPHPAIKDNVRRASRSDIDSLLGTQSTVHSQAGAHAAVRSANAMNIPACAAMHKTSPQIVGTLPLSARGMAPRQMTGTFSGSPGNIAHTPSHVPTVMPAYRPASPQMRIL